MICFIINEKPFDSSNGLAFELLNELTLLSNNYFHNKPLVLVIYIMLILFADLIRDSTHKFKLGWFIISLIGINLGANFVNMLVDVVLTIF